MLARAETGLGAPPPPAIAGRAAEPATVQPLPHREAYWRDTAARLRDDYLAERGGSLLRAGVAGSAGGALLETVPRLVRGRDLSVRDAALAAGLGAVLGILAEVLGLRVVPAGLRSVPQAILDRLPQYGADWRLYLAAIREEVCGGRRPLSLAWGRARVSAG